MFVAVHCRQVSVAWWSPLRRNCWN